MLFPWYIKYPNQNDEILNLDWILSTIDNLVTEVANFVSLNTIKYADPIQWNITTQYEKNTVVIDPVTGSAYISTQPVPSGVGLNNTDYWNIIFTLDVISANKNITLRDDANNMMATFESVVDDWLLWQGTLYIVTRDIDIGQAYVEGYNISRYTVEQFLKDYITNLKSLLETELEEVTGDLDDLETVTKTNLVAAINEVLDTLSTKIGDLSDLTTTEKDNLVEALNEVNNALGTIAGNIGDLDDLDTTDKDSIVEAINEVVGNLGNLSNLNTINKTNLVAAINEVFDDVDNIETNYLHYVYVEPYLENLSDTAALKAAIDDCPAKGVVILPMQTLNITETIVINKPITIKGLRGGLFQLEGGNNFTPNSDYVSYDLNFTAMSECFTVASPSVHFEDINIRFSTSIACKIFNLTSAAGDNLNMPRDIVLKNINCINASFASPTNAVYGVYSSQPVLLSEFDHVTFGWVTYGFYFDANINTSLTFKRCGVTCSQAGYYLANATYCNFYNCGCESQSPNGFYITGCKCITLINCYCEQITGVNFNIVSSYSVVLMGCFCTSGILIKTSLSSGAIIACQSSVASDASNPWLNLYGSYMKLLGMSDCFITTDNGNTTRRMGYSDKVVKYESTSLTGITASGITINGIRWSIVDTHVNIYMNVTALSTTGSVTMPAYVLPIVSQIIPFNGGTATLTYQNWNIQLKFVSTGTYDIYLSFDSMATQ